MAAVPGNFRHSIAMDGVASYRSPSRITGFAASGEILTRLGESAVAVNHFVQFLLSFKYEYILNKTSDCDVPQFQMPHLPTRATS